MARNLSSPKPAIRPGHSRICDLNVEVRPVSDLDVRTQNPRTHSLPGNDRERRRPQGMRRGVRLPGTTITGWSRLAIAGARVPAAYNTLTGDLGAARSSSDV